MILDLLSQTQFNYDAGAAATVTVPAGYMVLWLSCHASGAATLTITPGGANQTGIAGTAIPIPTGVHFFLPFLGQLGPGTRFAFSGTDSYCVVYGKNRQN